MITYDRITVAEAAKQLGKTEQSVRILMQRKKLPIGQVIDHGRKKEYLIWQGAVDKFKTTF